MSSYKLSKLAQQDLEDIWEYTVNEWSIEQAEKYISGLLSCFDAIAVGRMQGKPVDYVRRGYKKLLFGRHYIFFRISPEDIIEIIRVLHVRMDIEKHL